MADTDAKADKTSEEEGKNTEGKATGADTDAAKNQDAPKFTQADLDRIAAKTREEEKAKAKRDAEEAERKRKETEDEEQKKFEKLANDRKAEIEAMKSDHETLTQERDSYKTQVAALVTSELAALPEEVRDIAPAQYAEDKSLTNPLEVLAWLPKGKALAAKLNPDAPKKGMGRDPKPAGGVGDPNADKQAKAAQASMYRTL